MGHRELNKTSPTCMKVSVIGLTVLIDVIERITRYISGFIVVLDLCWRVVIFEFVFQVHKPFNICHECRRLLTQARYVSAVSEIIVVTEMGSSQALKAAMALIHLRMMTICVR